MKIIADCNNIGVRIDKIISGLCPSIPRTKIQEAIERHQNDGVPKK